jgi:hypothetical protein
MVLYKRECVIFIYINVERPHLSSFNSLLHEKVPDACCSSNEGPLIGGCLTPWNNEFSGNTGRKSSFCGGTDDLDKRRSYLNLLTIIIVLSTSIINKS